MTAEGGLRCLQLGTAEVGLKIWKHTNPPLLSPLPQVKFPCDFAQKFWIDCAAFEKTDASLRDAF